MHSYPMKYPGRKHLCQKLGKKGAVQRIYKRTTGAIMIKLYIERESHQVNSVRAKGCVHLMPGSRTKGTIKIRQASGRSICRVNFRRHVHEI